MPQFTFSQALTANQLGFNPFLGGSTSTFRGPHKSLFSFVPLTTRNGSPFIPAPRPYRSGAPVQGGGTAGNTPTEFTTAPVSFQGAAGDRLKLVIDNTGAGTPTVDGVIIANPLFLAMGKYNEILVGRYNRSITKLFGMKGPAAVAQLASDIQVSHSVFSGSENRFHEGWDRFGASLAPGPVAAQNSVAQLRNPGASGVIAVLEKMLVVTSLPDTAFNVTEVFSGIADLTNQFVGSALDGRTGRRSVLIPSSQNNLLTLLGLGLWQFPTTANVGVDFLSNLEIPMVPNHAIRFTTTVLNAILWVNLIWRERVLEDSERT